MTPFRCVLVANRGEIACRVIRSARDLGYETVAVYSDADADAPHVALADRACHIGPAPAAESYLDVDAIMAAARRAGADAIHPGYGFLAENAAFARAVREAGLVFIGPSPEAIDAMGDKAAAKQRMIEAGVPCVPGYQGDDQSNARLRTEAAQIGFPLLVKAAAGGGGRGMRRVTSASELEGALESARHEARSAFGHDGLILERLVERAHHVEIQVFADRHGNAVHLGERDCSTQRRHQKVIEEAPSPVVDEALRRRMGEAAVAAARAIDYEGAGTVEFLVDDRGEFYFLEMNTRLQVEHPVTELVTGLDLVALQLRVASGESLGLAQEDVRLEGHAIEVRLYAEDPYAGFAPQTGPVLAWAPAEQAGLRCDAGLREGQAITSYYDAMVAKLIAHGRDREEARRRLALGLRRTVLLGPRHNKRFLVDMLSHPSFVAGEVTTALLDGLTGTDAALLTCPRPETRDLAVATLLLIVGRSGAGLNPWRNAHDMPFGFDVDVDGETTSLVVELDPEGLRVTHGRDSARARLVSREAPRARVEVDGVAEDVAFAWRANPAAGHGHGAGGHELVLETCRCSATYAEHIPGATASEAAGDGRLRAPSSGKVLRVDVAVGDRVERGQAALTLEAMKIESTLACDVDGIVLEVRAAPGQQVENGAVLVVIEPAEPSGETTP